MHITHVLTHFPLEECHLDRLDKVLKALGEPLERKPFFTGRNVKLYRSRRGVFWFAGIKDNMDTDWVPFWNERFTHDFMNLIVVFVKLDDLSLDEVEDMVSRSGVVVRRGRISTQKGFLFLRREVSLPLQFLSVEVPHSGIEIAFYDGDAVFADGDTIGEVELRLIPEVVPLYRKLFFSLPLPMEGESGIYKVVLGSSRLIFTGREPYHRAIVRFSPSEGKYAGRGLNILSLRMETLPV